MKDNRLPYLTLVYLDLKIKSYHLFHQSMKTVRNVRTLDRLKNMKQDVDQVTDQPIGDK
ncbi:hypothetical protein ENLAB_02760 [Enterococcus innesii]|uniref:Uncharacterized protein n=1 Tax=Enterococcus innesii TaxID=2839759 RepID=A0ABN6NKE2_9ENTE|nr:hypothetical protein ENLAB_02760 [Enterococcus innesii]